MLEARELVQECITKGEQSAGYREFCGMAPGVALLPDSAGYRLYIESLFDELSTEVKVLFDRRDPASVLWPKRATFEQLLEILNAAELAGVWGEDETIGWVYQFFNGEDEREKMREESQAPRNSRELAVRNQFFTPRYVVQFLTDNTLGRIWYEMRGARHAPRRALRVPGPRRRRAGATAAEEGSARPAGPRPGLRLRPLPALRFDLLLAIYEEAWQRSKRCVRSEVDGPHAARGLPGPRRASRAAAGADPRAQPPRRRHRPALRADRRAASGCARSGRGTTSASPRDERPRIRRTHIVVAEPMPGDAALVDEFAARLDPPLLRDLFRKMVGEMRLAGELGTLLRVEDGIAAELRRAREQFVKQRQTTGFLPGMEPERKQGELDLSGIDDDRFFHEAEERIVEALRRFAETAAGGASVRRRLFADDAAQGVALIDLVRTRFDVVLMNPPFGAGSLAAKKEFEKATRGRRTTLRRLRRARHRAACTRMGCSAPSPRAPGSSSRASRSGARRSSLKEAPPVVFADLGYGVLDSAMVEVAAYCLEKAAEVAA